MSIRLAWLNWMDRWKLHEHFTFQKWSSSSHKVWLWKAIITLCQSAQLSFGNNSNSTRTTISLQLQISDILHLKLRRVSTILSVYSALKSFTYSAKSNSWVRKSSEKAVFPISQPNIHNSLPSRKLNNRIEIPVKFNVTKPTHNSSKVSSKVYLGNANRALKMQRCS